MSASPKGELTLLDAEWLAITRSKSLIAARLDVDLAQIERVVAGLVPNPELSLSVGNLILGAPNPQDQDPALKADFNEQTINTAEVRALLDVWLKRPLRQKTADAGIEVADWLLRDVVRSVRYAVQSAFAHVVREQSESELAGTIRARYDDTVALSRKRLQAGEISAAEQHKIELERLKHVNVEIDARAELALARQHLALLLAYESAEALPGWMRDEVPAQLALSGEGLFVHALQSRPDVQAARVASRRAEWALHSAERDAWPGMSLGLAYTRSYFQVSGDNPHTLGASIAIELPVFERNQGNIGRARVDKQRADNELSMLHLAVRREVDDAMHKMGRARQLLDVFEADMLRQAEQALEVADKSYHAGATSLLETLEAQRTYIETRGDYLRTRYDFRQAWFDMIFALGGEAP